MSITFTSGSDLPQARVTLQQQVASNINFAFFKQRVPNLIALSFEECIGHTAADQQDIDHVDEPFQDCYLIGDFGTAYNCCKGPARLFQGRTQEINFLLH